MNILDHHRNKNDLDRRFGCTSSLDESSKFHGIMLDVAIYPKSKEVSPGLYFAFAA
jgi:hypothetical protein